LALQVLSSLVLRLAAWLVLRLLLAVQLAPAAQQLAAPPQAALELAVQQPAVAPAVQYQLVLPLALGRLAAGQQGKFAALG
jgi:hypothetical protein